MVHFSDLGGAYLGLVYFQYQHVLTIQLYGPFDTVEAMLILKNIYHLILSTYIIEVLNCGPFPCLARKKGCFSWRNVGKSSVANS